MAPLAGSKLVERPWDRAVSLVARSTFTSARERDLT